MNLLFVRKNRGQTGLISFVIGTKRQTACLLHSGKTASLCDIHYIL